MLKTPILFILFNRPDVTQISFERIREIKPLKLYVAADGPREDKLNEAEICEQTRNIIKTIDWDCEVHKLYQTKNLGCGKGVSTAINWFFEQEEKGIIIEDDILADLSFFAYCETLLDYYENDTSVMHINGCNFQNEKKQGNGSYYFSAFPHVWGWATWRRAWRLYDFNLSDLNYFYNLKKIENYFDDKKIINTWHEILFKMNRKWIDTWDYQWNYAIWNNRGKVITPNINLIKNIGFSENATHTIDETSKFSKMQPKSISKIIHPTSKLINKEADEYSYYYCN